MSDTSYLEYLQEAVYIGESFNSFLEKQSKERLIKLLQQAVKAKTPEAMRNALKYIPKFDFGAVHGFAKAKIEGYSLLHSLAMMHLSKIKREGKKIDQIFLKSLASFISLNALLREPNKQKSEVLKMVDKFSMALKPDQFARAVIYSLFATLNFVRYVLWESNFALVIGCLLAILALFSFINAFTTTEEEYPF